MAGYHRADEGGIGPILAKAIPITEQSLFKAFADRLLEGPPLSPKLRWQLSLVVLLRHPDVSKKYPGHRLIQAVERTAAEVGVSAALLQKWVGLIHKSWIDENATALCISQVNNAGAIFKPRVYMFAYLLNPGLTMLCIW